MTPLHSLRSAPNELFQPLRTNDSCSGSFAVYREPSEFVPEYTRKYDEDLKTSPIFVSSLIPVPHPEHRVLTQRYTGWSVLCSRLRVHHRCASQLEAAAQPGRNGRQLHVTCERVNTNRRREA